MFERIIEECIGYSAQYLTEDEKKQKVHLPVSIADLEKALERAFHLGKISHHSDEATDV